MAHRKGNIYEWRRIIDEAYATMDDGPEDYLFRKDGKQKLVGSADNDICSTCGGQGDVQTSDGEVVKCPDCDGKCYNPQLEEDDTAGYRYRDEQDYEEDNIKTWHYGKAPGGDWEVIDLSPYAHVDDFMWALIVDFHKKNGRWPDRDEGHRMEQLQHEKWKKENE
jgi:hypothetical protein